MAVAAADVADIESAIDSARTAAGGPTTSVLAAAQDEVSAAAAELFGAVGRQYQTILKRAMAFHDAFAAALKSAGAAYTQAEAASAQAMSDALGGGGASTGIAAASKQLIAFPQNPAGSFTSVILGGSGDPIPSPSYISSVIGRFVQGFFPNGTPLGLDTPEEFFPISGIRNLTLDQSVAEGLTILNNQIQSLLAVPGNGVNVLGYSQSAIIASMEMHLLDPSNTPLGSGIPLGNLNFSLIGDPLNPNGGLFSRFPNLSLSSLGITLGGSTPDNSFPTKIFTLEYDAAADFPQYPINVLSDLNAFFGFLDLHGTYPNLTAAQLASAIQLPTSGQTLTQYYMIPVQNLPLLDPLRAIPVIGNPLADLVQPDLSVLVNLGYGSTTQGWSTGPANVTTPFGVLPPVGPGQILSALAAAAPQGVNAFTHDLANMGMPTLSGPMSTGTGGGSSLLPPGLIAQLTSALSSPDNFIHALATANTNIVTTISDVATNSYSFLLPTADLVNTALTTIPSYDLNLFLGGVEQALDGDPVNGLITAIGAPIAADVALGTFGAGIELESLLTAVEGVL
jgi:PE-PPE domain/PE family